MFRRHYTLHDIEKILTWVPPLFFVVLMGLAILTTRTAMNHREASEIALLKQKQFYEEQTLLDAYLSAVNQDISRVLELTHEQLKRNVHLLEGAWQTLVPDGSLQTLMPYLKRLEAQNDIRFVLFDENLTILYGKPQLEKIEELIFNKSNDPNFLTITMQYILSQGDASSHTWKNDMDKTVQMSYFRHIPTAHMYVGAFSRVDNLRNITRNAFVTAMYRHRYTPKGYYFWLYDQVDQLAFNLHNQAKWRSHTLPDGREHLRELPRYFLSIGIRPNDTHHAEAIRAVKKQYDAKRTRITLLILFSGIMLILFAWVFAAFIKRIFSIYDKRVHHTNQRLKRLKERYELAVIASNDGLWDTHFKTHRTFFSQKWLDIVGYRPGEITTYDAWIDLIHPEDKTRVVEIIESHKHSRSTDPIICEYRLRTRQGSYIWILGRGKIFFDKQGEPERLLMMSMDITERKEASERLAEAVRKEVAKNQEKQKLLIQQSRLAAMGEMIGAIAHQWRQPLNNITLILHFIRDSILSGSYTESMIEEYVARAKKQIDYMSDTIDDFRDFHKPSKHKTRFDIREAIASTLSIMETQLERNHITVEIHGESFTLEGYENEFRQALLNIFANAKDAIAHQQERDPAFEGRIEITLQTHSITVYNNGGKVSEDVLERMFDPYFTTKFENQGTGIGLYMTRTIIENNMHGEIRAQNRDQGVSFTIRFHQQEEPDA
jgi:PAS domain S-box-containing protein